MRSSTYKDNDKAYVVGVGLKKATYTPSEPSTPAEGDLWLDSDNQTPSQIGIFIESNSVKHVSYDPSQPSNPNVGDVWIDSDQIIPKEQGIFIESNSVENVYYSPEIPSNPKPGDLWVDSDAQTPIQLGLFVEGNSVKKVSYDAAKPAFPIAGDLWIDPAGYSEPSLATPLNLTNATEDVLLVPGRTAYLYFNHAQVPLMVKSEEGIYEIILAGSIVNPILVANVAAQFLPNNAVHSGKFTCNNNATQLPNKDYFLLDSGLLVQGRWIISTHTGSKSITFKTVSKKNATDLSVMEGAGLWNDSTTLWTSLGKIIFPFAQSGEIIIRRLA
jgi:hypothetical protein